MQMIISKEQMEKIVAEYFDEYGGIFYVYQVISVEPVMTAVNQWNGQDYQIVFELKKEQQK